MTSLNHIGETLLKSVLFFTCSEKYVCSAACDFSYGFSNTTCDCHVICNMKKNGMLNIGKKS